MKEKVTSIAAQDRSLKLLMLPLVFTIIFLSTLPLVISILASFTDWSAGIDVPINFIGFENFRYLASDTQFFASFKLGLVWTLSVTTLVTLMGISLALLLNQDKKYMGPMKLLSLSPWAMSPPAIAVIWTTMMNPNSGPVNNLLRSLGLSAGEIGFLEDPTYFFPTLVIIGTWALMPMITLAVLAALKTIPKELEEAMEIDGASPLVKFRNLILPHIKPILVPLVALNLIWNFGSFDLIYVIVGGFPPPNSEIPIVFAFRQAFKYGEFGYASTLGVAIAVFELTLVAVILRRQFRSMSE